MSAATRPRKPAARLRALALIAPVAVTTFAVFNPSAHADAPPTFETAALNPGTKGHFGFYNASGAQVYGGKLSDDPQAAYFVADGGALKAGDTSATLTVWKPETNKAEYDWTLNNTVTAGDTFGSSSDSQDLPGALKGTTKAFARGLAGGTSINDTIAAIGAPNDTNNPNIYSLHLTTGFDVSVYYDVDIKIDQAAGTWTQVYPAPPAPATATTTTLTSSANPAMAGASVTLTAKVAPAGAAGTVQFKDGATNIGSAIAVNASGVATTTTTFTAGSHSLTATFAPTNTAAYTGSTGSLAQTVDAPATATSTKLGASPASSAEVGAAVTFTATVSPAASGTVQFKDGSTNLGSPVTVSSGTALLTTSALTVGAHSITAAFVSADGAYLGSNSSALSYTINPKPANPTTTTLDVAPGSPQTVGTPVTLTATVSPGNAVGTVKFFDGTTQVGSTQTWSGSPVSVATSALAVGSHNLKAQFFPTDVTAYGASSSAVTAFQIDAISTSTTMAGVVTPVTYGTSTSMTATVSPVSAEGKVQFLDGTTAIGSPVAASASTPGTYTLDHSFAAGNHDLSARFVPANASYAASASLQQSLTVDKAPTSTTVTSSAATASYGTAVTFTATVNKADASGAVQFAVDGANHGSPMSLTNAKAALTLSSLGAGAHTVTATYIPGDSSNYTGSMSNTASVTITKSASTTSLAASPSGNVEQGKNIAFSATVSPAASTGSVAFSEGATVLGSAAVSSGKAVLNTDTLAVGVHSVVATFVPSDANNVAGSTSSAVTVNVVPATTTTLTGPSSNVDYGSDLELNATVAPSNAAGTVDFLDGAKVLGSAAVMAGEAGLSLNTLSGGEHTLTARFVPADPTAWAGSSAQGITVTINPQPTALSMVLAPAGPVRVGTTLKLTATVAPTSAAGSVMFLDGSATVGTAKVVAGTAKLSTSTLAVGTHTLTAKFVPANAAAYASATAAADIAVEAGPQISVSDGSGAALTSGQTLKAGDELAFRASGFGSGEKLKAQFHSTPVDAGAFTADAKGSVSGTVTIPGSLEPGIHTLTVSGSVDTAKFIFKVAANQTDARTPTSELPHTGAVIARAVTIGLGVILVGLVAIAVSRRRRMT